MMQSQGIKSEEKRRATGKNGKQIHGDILPTWSLLHDPEETQPIAWPCAVSMGRLYRKHAQQQSIKVRTKEEIYLQAPSHLVSPTGQNLPHWWLTPPTSRFSNLIPLAKRNKPHTLQTWYGICARLFYRQLGYVGNYVFQNPLSYMLKGLYLSGWIKLRLPEI